MKLTKADRYTNRPRPAGPASGACISLFFLVLFLVPPAESAGMFDPGGGEIHITSEQMVMQTEQQVAEFIGDVHATQADTSVSSERLRVFYKRGNNPNSRGEGLSEDAIRRVVATGSVIIDFQDKRALCDEAVYTADDGLLILTGAPARLESRDSTVAGQQITLNQKTGEVVVGGDNNGRVEAVFQSGSSPDNTGKQSGPQGKGQQ